MKAAVYKGKQRLVVEEIPTPVPGPGQVLIRVRYCAICGTDVHAFLHDAVPADTVMGHEFSGTVARVGPGVSTWKEGDRIVGGGGTPPPEKGPAWVTEKRFNFRNMGYAGRRTRGFAEFALLEEWEPLPTPDKVSDEAAALCEPCGCSVRAVRNSNLRLGNSAVVLGAGPIGLLCLQAAKAAGAGTVIVSEPVPARREKARSLGAEVVLDPSKDKLVPSVLVATGGLGADVVFDCAGVGPTLDQATSMVRRWGQVVLVALPWEPVTLNPVDWIAMEVKLQTTFGSRSEDWQTALEFMRSGTVTMDPLLSEADFVPLDAIQRAFVSQTQPAAPLKTFVKPW